MCVTVSSRLNSLLQIPGYWEAFRNCDSSQIYRSLIGFFLTYDAFYWK